MYRILIAVLFILSACNQVSDQTSKIYYIDAEMGSDNNTGRSEKQAWKTLNKISSTNISEGTNVLLKRGQVFYGSIKLENMSGTELNPVIIGSFGNPDFRFPEIYSCEDYSIHMDGCSFVQIKNLKLSGKGRKEGNTSSGFIVGKSNSIHIDSIEITGYQKSGLEVISSTDIRITNVTSNHNGSTGIRIAGSYENGFSKNVYIGYCVTNDNAGDQTAYDNHSGSGIIVSYTDGALVEYCSASNNGWDMPRQGNGPVGIWAHDANMLTIQYCIAYKNDSPRDAADGGGFDLDGGITNSLVQYNYSYDNNGAGYGLFQYYGTTVWENNVIRYNISYNDGEGNEKTGIYIWSAEPHKDLLRNCKIYNNLVINELGSAIKYSGDNDNNSTNPNGFEFYNNIFVSKDEPIEGIGTKTLFSNNLWFRIDNQVIAKKYDINGIYGKQPGIIMPQPHNYRLTDPTKLKSLELFRLQEDSPCHASGKNVGDPAVVNFWGEVISKKPNIGIE